ncbi:MAG TPA: AI-2E family transporter [Acidimicrobiia bacterium]|nr:AI-2E family transporter [Acidimicrobiia bacterium]
MTDSELVNVPRWFRRGVWYAISAVLLTAGVLWLLSRVTGLFLALLMAVFVSFALEPAVKYLAGRGWSRGVATGIVFIVTGVLFVAFVAIMVPAIVDQGTAFAEDLPDYVDEVTSALDEWLDITIAESMFEGGSPDFAALLSDYGSDVASGLLGFGSALLGAVITGLTVALFAFYMVAEGPKFRRVVLRVFRPDRQREMLRIWEIAVEKTGGYVYSRLLLAAASALIAWIALRILGIPNALALAIWVGVVSQFVPAVGTYIAAVLPVLAAFFESPVKALWVLVVLIAYQQIENYLLAPRITARTMSLHPAVAFGSAIAGIGVLGALGAVIALPTAAIIQAVISGYLELHPFVDEPGAVS